jgi:hypothetical protein
MTDLKRENYYAMQHIENRNRDILQIEEALKELEIPIENISDYDEESYE